MTPSVEDQKVYAWVWNEARLQTWGRLEVWRLNGTVYFYFFRKNHNVIEAIPISRLHSKIP